MAANTPNDEDEIQFWDGMAYMFKKAEERFEEQKRDPNPMADKLIEACIHGRVGEVKWLLQKKNTSPNVVRVNGTPAGISVMSSQADELLGLLALASADFNIQDQNGWSPLFIATSNNRIQVVQRLISLKANVDLSCPSNGWTALMSAASFGHVKLAIDLLSAGADPSIRSKDGLTALDIASANGKTAVVSVLKRYFELISRRQRGL